MRGPAAPRGPGAGAGKQSQAWQRRGGGPAAAAGHDCAQAQVRTSVDSDGCAPVLHGAARLAWASLRAAVAGLHGRPCRGSDMSAPCRLAPVRPAVPVPDGSRVSVAFMSRLPMGGLSKDGSRVSRRRGAGPGPCEGSRVAPCRPASAERAAGWYRRPSRQPPRSTHRHAVS